MDAEVVTVLVSVATIVGAGLGAYSRGFLKTRANGTKAMDTKMSDAVLIDTAVLKSQYEGIVERLESGQRHFGDLHEDVKATRQEVRELRDECRDRLDDHEGRMRILERGR